MQEAIKSHQIRTYHFISYHVFSPPARWGLLDFMSVASSSSSSSSSSSFSSLFSSSFSSSSSPLFSSPLLVSSPPAPCRTSTTTIHAQCALPDLNHDHPRPVFPAGPQPRPSPPSVPCRTSTTTIPAQCSLPDLNWAVMVVVEVRQGTLGGDGCGWGPAGNTGRGWSWLRSGREHREYPRQKICHIECQKICQIEC